MLCGCGLLDPATDGSHVGVISNNVTNDIPAAAIATAVGWMAYTVFGVPIPTAASVPAVIAVITVWAYLRRRKTQKATE
jgi:hypothetical protein